MAKLQIKNLSKSFGDVKVLDHININASDGEFVVLVGPSGSGKSTILRIIAGLEKSTSGEIQINNKIITELSPKDRDIAMVFQNYALYPHMSVYENLAFPLKMKNTSKDEIKKAVNETSELLGIKHYLKKKPKELSGGERQRVALGRAIIRKPLLFLMDEPLSNLDAKLRTQMRSELLKLHKTLSTTVIYVTHDQVEALTMGNKIVVLNQGKIQQIGTPHDIYTNPENIFVAGFIGSPGMNFFDSEIINGNIKLFKEKKLTLGIRPEHMSLIDKPTSSNKDDEIIFEASIYLLEMLGNEHLIHATIIGKKQKTSFTIKVFKEHNLKINDKITVSIDLNKAYYFDTSSGNRL